MSNTRSYLVGLKNILSHITEFAVAPLIWASGGYDKKESISLAGPNASEANQIVAIGVEMAVCGCCQLAICCCRLPCALVAEAVTCPLGTTTAVIATAFGVTALPFVALSDLPEKCQSKPNPAITNCSTIAPAASSGREPPRILSMNRR